VKGIYIHIGSKTKKVTVSSTYIQVRSVVYLAARIVAELVFPFPICCCCECERGNEKKFGGKFE
jgi:hypothetical protein